MIGNPSPSAALTRDLRSALVEATFLQDRLAKLQASVQAMIEEVEHLRAENGNVRAEAGGMEMEIFDLRAQMKQLGADMAELARVRAALNAEALDLVPARRMMQAIAEERAATEARIVEYLRRCANVAADMPVVAVNFESVADCIERGEHRREEEP